MKNRRKISQEERNNNMNYFKPDRSTVIINANCPITHKFQKAKCKQLT